MISHALTMNHGLGTRIIGRCFLPYQAKERTDGGFDLLFNLRSNFGGLRQQTGVGLGIDYRRRDKQFVLKIKEVESHIETRLPLLILNDSTLNEERTFDFEDYLLVKPNKHFLKRYGRTVLCKGGVLTIPLILTSVNGEQLEGSLRLYPSVVDGKEFLVVVVSNFPLLAVK